MKTMTIGKKISLACAALVAFTVILGTTSILGISSTTAHLRSIVDDSLPGLYLIGQIQNVAKEQKVAMLLHLSSGNPQQMAASEAAIADLDIRFQALSKEYQKSAISARDRELFEKVQPAQEKMLRVWASIRPLDRAAKKQEALALWMSDAVPASNERAQALVEVFELNRSTGDATGKAAMAAVESTRFWSVLILVFSVGSGGFLAFWIVRGVDKVLTQAVTELTEGAEQVSSASAQVSGSSQSLAQDATEQAASLEETSAASKEMASTTRKNALNSQQAAEYMNAVSRQVAAANKTLGEMMTSMQEIDASSSKISKIIKVIDEIAFQTNILALNAAVEAARAGESGMGFGVVADEVRNLAQRSAQAAKDTACLIEESIQKSSEGSRKLGEVAGSIQAITDGAGKVKTLVDEVEASSKEQALGIEQISKAVSEMDQVTQRTAASAEESAAASEELNAQSQALMAVVEQLQSLVGAGGSRSERTRYAVAANLPVSVSSSQNSHRAAAAIAPARKPASALSGAATRRASEFPLDDSEFKEF